MHNTLTVSPQKRCHPYAQNYATHKNSKGVSMLTMHRLPQPLRTCLSGAVIGGEELDHGIAAMQRKHGVRGCAQATHVQLLGATALTSGGTKTTNLTLRQTDAQP